MVGGSPHHINLSFFSPPSLLTGQAEGEILRQILRSYPFYRFPAGIGMGIVLGLGAFLLMASGWWYFTRSLRELPWEQVTSSDSEPAVMVSLAPTRAWWVILWEVIYAEIHWAFYRAGPIVLLDDYYAGVFLGFLVLNLEWWTDPAWRHGWGSVEQRRDVVLRWSLAFVMAIIFLFTRNLWLAIPLHWAIEMGCRHWLPVPPVPQ